MTRRVRRRFYFAVPLALLVIGASACGGGASTFSSGSTAPHLASIAPSDPLTIAQGVTRELPTPTWTGQWHFSADGTRSLTVSRLAVDTFGGQQVAGKLTAEGMTGGAHAGFQLRSTSGKSGGLLGVTILGFDSDKNATERAEKFLTSQGDGGETVMVLSGVPHSGLITSSTGTCGKTCSDSTFTYPIGKFVVWGRAGCTVAQSTCRQVTGTVAQSVYRSLSPGST